MAREDLVITIKAVDQASGAFKGMGQVIGSVQKNVDSLNETARNLNWMFLGQDLLRAARTGATGLLSLAKASSDVTEAQNFVQQVFEDSTQSVLDFAKNSTKATLMSEKAILDAAATFGVFGQSAGLAGEDLADFSTNLVLLAADMASIKNTTVDQAINAIGAAFRNEHTPIRQYGAALDEATLKGKALELGIYDGTGALTTQQRVIATNQLLYEQMGFAIGDVGRTFDEVANQQRLLSAQFENFKASIGGTLIPMFQNVMRVAQGAMDVFQGLPKPLQDLALNTATAATATLALGGGILLMSAKVMQGVQAFRDMRGSMNDWVASGGRARGVIAGLGKVVGGLGLAFAGAQIGIDLFNDITNYAGKTADAVDDIAIAFAKVDTHAAISAFQDLAKAENDAAKFAGLWEDWGKELQVGLEGPVVSIENLDDAFNKLLESGGVEQAGMMLSALTEQAAGMDKTSRAYKDTMQIIERYTPKVQRATQAAQASGTEHGLSAEQIEKYGAAELEATKASEEMADGIEGAAEALGEMRDALNAAETAVVPLADKVEDFGTAAEQSLGNTEWVDNLVEGFDAVAKLTEGLKDEDDAVRKSAESLDIYSEAGRDQLKILDDLGEVIGTDMTRAYKESGGSVEEARKTMQGWRDEIQKQMQDAGIAQPVIDAYLERLNLTDGTFESIIKLSGQEEARRKLDELNIEYQNLPPYIYTQVQALIDAGDYQGAYQVMKDFLESTIETPVDTTGEQKAATDAKATIDRTMSTPVDQPIDTTNTDRNETKGWFTSLFGNPVGQLVDTANNDRYETKGWFTSLFGNPVGQLVDTSNNDRSETKQTIRGTFTNPVQQEVTTYNTDRHGTKNMLSSFFSSAVNQVISTTRKITSIVVPGIPWITSASGAAAPSAAEYAATSAPGVSSLRAVSLPAPVTAGRYAPTSTAPVINLQVNMPVGVNETKVVDLLRRYQRNNGAGRLAS